MKRELGPVSHEERRKARKERREQRQLHRASGIERYTITAIERRPVILFHASLLVGVIEPYIYPSLPPLMLMMSRIAHSSEGLESQARDAFNFTWLYSMTYCAITCVTLALGISDGVNDVTIWHWPLILVYIGCILRAIFEIRKDGGHNYALPARPLRANSEETFMGRT